MKPHEEISVMGIGGGAVNARQASLFEMGASFRSPACPCRSGSFLHMIRTGIKLGGPGKVVQIDESLFCHKTKVSK